MTVLKSLILSKITHLCLALQNPPGELIKFLEAKMNNVSWNNGPDRIKWKNIQEYTSRWIENGQYLCIHNFIESHMVKSRKENPQKLTQLSPRSHPRLIMLYELFK